MLFYLPVLLSLGPRRKLELDLLQFSIWHCFTKICQFFSGFGENLSNIADSLYEDTRTC